MRLAPNAGVASATAATAPTSGVQSRVRRVLKLFIWSSSSFREVREQQQHPAADMLNNSIEIRRNPRHVTAFILRRHTSLSTELLDVERCLFDRFMTLPLVLATTYE